MVLESTVDVDDNGVEDTGCVVVRFAVNDDGDSGFVVVEAVDIALVVDEGDVTDFVGLRENCDGDCLLVVVVFVS